MTRQHDGGTRSPRNEPSAELRGLRTLIAGASFATAMAFIAGAFALGAAVEPRTPEASSAGAAATAAMRQAATLTGALRDGDDDARAEAAAALAGAPGEASPLIVPALAATALEDDARWVRDVARESLGRTAAPAATEALIAALVEEPRALGRIRLVRALGEIGGERVEACLLDLVVDRSELIDVRIEAARALGPISESPIVATRLAAVLGDADPHLRAAVATTLGVIASDDESIARALGDALETTEHPIRWRIAVAILAVGSTEPRDETAAIAVIEAVLLADTGRVRQIDVADALAAIGERAQPLIPTLTACLDADCALIRTGAHAALVAITHDGGSTVGDRQVD